VIIKLGSQGKGEVNSVRFEAGSKRYSALLDRRNSYIGGQYEYGRVGGVELVDGPVAVQRIVYFTKIGKVRRIIAKVGTLPRVSQVDHCIIWHRICWSRTHKGTRTITILVSPKAVYIDLGTFQSAIWLCGLFFSSVREREGE
jgi:hypothetical protein